jgi:hypothetical protein
MIKQGVKRLYRKFESIWEDELPDVHGNHRRRLYKVERRRLRRFLYREANKEIKNETE